MAISFVAAATAESSSANSLTPSEPAGAAENDLIVALGTLLSASGSWTDPADFTGQEETEAGIYWGYKVRGADAGSGYNFTHSATAAAMRVTLACFRGVDTSSPLDVTYSKASHLNDNTDDAGATAPSAITTATDNAWVVVMQWIRSDASYTQGMPTGYTSRFDGQLADRAQSIGSKLVASADTETPGGWNHTGVAAGADSTNITLAIRPGAAGILLSARALSGGMADLRGGMHG